LDDIIAHPGKYSVMLFEGIARAFAGAEGNGALAPEPGRRAPRVGLALGAGAARGWAHIGIMRALAEAGIAPDIIAGCSMGAVVGGCYAAGKLGELETFALSLSKRRVMGLLDFHISGSGLISGDRLRRLLSFDLGDLRIEDLPCRFATVATELGTGHEIWLTRGSLVDALRASYALPGVFDPVRLGGRWLMDGALVNPVPVTMARALGADLVVCVNLNADIRVRGTVIQAQEESTDFPLHGSTETRQRGLLDTLRDVAGRGRPRRAGDAPGIASVMIEAFNITQDRISRSRLAGDPPDLMISPKLAPIGLFEFHRAQDCLELGRHAAQRALPDIHELIARTPATTRPPQAVAI
jgi:NTE family protein